MSKLYNAPKHPTNKPSNIRDGLQLTAGAVGLLASAAILPAYPLLGIAGVAASAALMVDAIRSLRSSKVNVCSSASSVSQRGMFASIFTSKDLTPQNFNPNSRLHLKVLHTMDRAHSGSVKEFLERLPLDKLDKLDPKQFSPNSFIQILNRQDKLITPSKINVRDKKEVKQLEKFAKKMPSEAASFFSKMSDQGRRDLFNATSSSTLKGQLVAAKHAARATGVDVSPPAQSNSR